MSKPENRPVGITLLSLFFLFGALMSFISFVALLFPDSFLEPMWQINPRAKEGFPQIVGWAIALMVVVLVACTFTAIGLWRENFGVIGLLSGFWL
jgi:hypothetical protein